MSTHVHAYIKACEAYGWEGGDEFKTVITPMENGGERRNAAWRNPRHSYSTSFLNIPIALYRFIKEMHINRRGRWGAFLYYDLSDNEAVNAKFGVGDGMTTVFQLAQETMVEGYETTAAVYAIYEPDMANPGDALESDIEVSVGGILSTAFVVDRDRGLIEFDSPPAYGDELRWSGRFSRWVRFDNDRLPFSIDNQNASGYVMNGSVDLVEISAPKLPES